MPAPSRFFNSNWYFALFGYLVKFYQYLVDDLLD